MAVLSNRPQGTGTPKAIDYSTKSKTFAETAPKTFDDIPNKFDNPQDFANLPASSASSLTNRPADS